jgi:sugar (pentulose or hexulose) kinase
LLWLARNEPEVFAQTSKLLMASSYLVLRLTGRYVLDHHSASQCDPMYDLADASWAYDWSSAIAPALELPELFWPNEIVGTITASAATATGIPTDDWNPVARTVTPKSANTDRYAEFYAHFRSLYPATQDLAHFLAAQQHQS